MNKARRMARSTDINRMRSCHDDACQGGPLKSSELISNYFAGTVYNGSIRTTLANEMRYVIYQTTETRLPVPTAIVRVMALLANESLFMLRRIPAASKLKSYGININKITSFCEAFVSIVMF